MSHEIPAVKKAIADLNIECKLTVIMVNKRISTRYFLTEGSSIRNPLPGTFVDRDIVKQGVYDFYLVSQRTKQGAASPTHYTVLLDEIQPDNPHEYYVLSYKLCHLYFHTAGGIRVPAPVQYAHRLSELIGEKVNANVRRNEQMAMPGAELSEKPSLYWI